MASFLVAVFAFCLSSFSASPSTRSLSKFSARVLTLIPWSLPSGDLYWKYLSLRSKLASSLMCSTTKRGQCLIMYSITRRDLYTWRQSSPCRAIRFLRIENTCPKASWLMQADAISYIAVPWGPQGSVFVASRVFISRSLKL